METELVQINNPDELNLILGQSHFIKTCEDIYEALVGTVPGIKFGLAFCEASGQCLIRTEGNDENLVALAVENAQKIGAGHSFILFLSGAFPVNVLRAVRDIPEVCHIYAATANPLQVIVAKSQQGRGILGVIDGSSPKGVETEANKAERIQFLRTIGYKRC